MIATAILAVVFAYLSGSIIQGGFLQAKAPLYTQSSLLLRGVVLDLEAEYWTEGFPENAVSNKHCELPRDAGKGFECEYDLEKLDLDQGQLGEMASNMLEQIMGGVGENGSILQAFPALGFLFIPDQAMPFGVSPVCPMPPSQFKTMCNISVEKVTQNIYGMFMLFPMVISLAASQTRKLRIRISHDKHDSKDPVLEIETYIISIPEELRAGTKETPEIPGVGGLQPGQPGQPGQPKTGQPIPGAPTTEKPLSGGGGR